MVTMIMVLMIVVGDDDGGGGGSDAGSDGDCDDGCMVVRMAMHGYDCNGFNKVN